MLAMERVAVSYQVDGVVRMEVVSLEGLPAAGQMLILPSGHRVRINNVLGGPQIAAYGLSRVIDDDGNDTGAWYAAGASVEVDN